MLNYKSQAKQERPNLSHSLDYETEPFNLIDEDNQNECHFNRGLTISKFSDRQKFKIKTAFTQSDMSYTDLPEENIGHQLLRM